MKFKPFFKELCPVMEKCIHLILIFSHSYIIKIHIFVIFMKKSSILN